MVQSSPRVAVRAVILCDDRLLLVNAFGKGSDLMCAPGGGVQTGSSLPENLAREVFEETGLTVDVGAPCLVNEFHDPKSGFHQVEVFFRCTLTAGQIDPDWQDPEGIVKERVFVTRDQMQSLRFRPRCLDEVAFDADAPIRYDPLELLVR